MQFSTLLVTTASLLSLTAVSAKPLTARQGSVAGVYACKDANFAGTCQKFTPNFDTCDNLPAEWNDVISSVGPDQGNFCRFFQDTGCGYTDPNVPFFDLVGPPGVADLNTTGWNDRISSFQCSVWTGAKPAWAA